MGVICTLPSLQLIEELNRELSTYEIAASHAPVSASSSSSTSHTHSSHSSEVTGPLVDSVQRMMHYLHQSETQLKGEVAIRGQFLQTLNEQQDLMDVLTAVSLKGEGGRERGRDMAT